MSTQIDKKQYTELENQKLDVLADIVSGLKSIAHNIGTEVDEHNEIINDIENNVEGTTEDMKNKTKKIKKITDQQKCCGASTCNMLYLYIAGFIQIVIVIVILVS